MKFTVKLVPEGRTSNLEFTGLDQPPFETIGVVATISHESPFKPRFLEIELDTEDAHSLSLFMANFSLSIDKMELISKKLKEYYTNLADDRKKQTLDKDRLISMFSNINEQ